MRTAGIAGRTADAKHLSVWDNGATYERTGLHCNRAHVPIIGVIPVGMVQADVNAEVDPVILRIPPAGIDDLVCVCGGVDGTIRDAVVHAIVTIVINPIAEAVRPVSTCTRVADTRLGRRCAWRRWRRTVLARPIASVGKDNSILGVIGSGMVEDGFLRSSAGIGRIEEGRDRRLQREPYTAFRRSAAHTEENAAEQESYQCILERMSHDFGRSGW